MGFQVVISDIPPFGHDKQPQTHNSPVHGLKAKALLQAAALVTEDIKGELAVVRSHSAVAHTSKGQSAH